MNFDKTNGPFRKKKQNKTKNKPRRHKKKKKKKKKKILLHSLPGNCTRAAFTRLLDLFYLNLALLEPVSCLRFSPDGQLLAICSSSPTEGVIHLFRVQDPVTQETSYERATLSPSVPTRRHQRRNRQPRHRPGVDGDDFVTQIDWSTDSRFLRSNGKNGQLRYWRKRRKHDGFMGETDGRGDDEDDEEDWLEEAGQTIADEAAAVRAVEWASHSCRVDVNACGIWRDAADAAKKSASAMTSSLISAPSWDDVTAVAVNSKSGVMAAAGKDGFVRLLTYPTTPTPGAGFLAERGHVATGRGVPPGIGGVSSLCWASKLGGEEVLISSGYADVAIMQWNV